MLLFVPLVGIEPTYHRLKAGCLLPTNVSYRGMFVELMGIEPISEKVQTFLALPWFMQPQ